MNRIVHLPAEAFVTADQVVDLSQRGFDIAFCSAASDAAECFRPVDHGGRHAFINDYTGEVYAVFGEDVHADARARGHAALESRAIEASNARQSTFYAEHDRTMAARS